MDDETSEGDDAILNDGILDETFKIISGKVMEVDLQKDHFQWKGPLQVILLNYNTIVITEW